MSNLLIDYAVSIERHTPAVGASLAFMHRLGVMVTPIGGIDTNAQPIVRVNSMGAAKVMSNGRAVLPHPTEVTVAVLNAKALTAIKVGTAFKLTDAGSVDLDGSGAGVAVAAGTIGEIFAYNGSALESVGKSVYADTDALNYIVESEVIGDVIRKLGGIYLVLNHDPQVIQESGSLSFFTLTYASSVDDAAVIGAITQWEGVVFLGSGAGAAHPKTGNSDGIVVTNLDSEELRLSMVVTMLSDFSWRNQQYSEFVPLGSATGSAMAARTIGDSNNLFESHTSFYLWDGEDSPAYLGFLGTTTGLSITSPYVRKEIELKVQNAFVTLVSLNEPYNVLTTRKVLKREFAKIVADYVGQSLLDSSGVNTVDVTLDDERFYVKGKVSITNSSALWRARISSFYGEAPINADGTTF